jgi:ring-1,2-phenylacetyl-CoA epoxidase subunit PaaD
VSRAATAAAGEAEVWAALAEIPDPEIPTVSMVDLGVIHRVERSPDRLRVEILPTFVGCPAIDAMKRAVEARLAGMAPEVEVTVTFEQPWSSDRITDEGREKLRTSGFAPPGPVAGQLLTVVSVVPCPHCGSRRTMIENVFGPTLCRAIHYCTDCRQPFEGFKSV